MKVLHVIPGIAARYGGPSSALLAMCGALSKCNIDLEVATTNADGPGQQLNPGQIESDVKIHFFPRRGPEQWKYAPELGAWLDQNIPTFDVTHIHALWSYSSLASSRAAIKHRIPYIIRPAGMLSDFTFRNGALKKRLYWQLLERKTALHASLFHATSFEEKQEIEARIPNAKVEVIPNGIEDSAWHTIRNPEVGRELLQCASTDLPIVLYLSRLHPKKGIIDRLIPAFERVKTESILAIVGGKDSHDPEYATAVQQRVADSSKRDHIRLIGELNGTDRWAAFDAASLFALPSHNENFGIVVAEAMARSCPVIITPEVQSAHHVNAAGAGFVVPGDTDAVAAKIDLLLQSQALGHELGRNGREYARQHLSWNEIAKQLIEIYRRIDRPQSSTKRIVRPQMTHFMRDRV